MGLPFVYYFVRCMLHSKSINVRNEIHIFFVDNTRWTWYNGRKEEI